MSEITHWVDCCGFLKSRNALLGVSIAMHDFAQKFISLFFVPWHGKDIFSGFYLMGLGKVELSIIRL